jgi:hypothetical protein
MMVSQRRIVLPPAECERVVGQLGQLSLCLHILFESIHEGIVLAIALRMFSKFSPSMVMRS